MTSSQSDPTNCPAWQALSSLAKDPNNTTISIQFETDSDRVDTMSVQAGELFLDFSKNQISMEVWHNLIALAEDSNLHYHREAMFAGDKINKSEDRAVLHSALRGKLEDSLDDDTRERSLTIAKQLRQMEQLSSSIRDGSWCGSTGKSITDVVNIGIGGSDLGPKLACAALEEFSHPSINLHFIANVDGAEILTTLAKLNPETTLVTIASKTFTTQETLLNAKTALQWFESTLGLANAKSSTHFIALTAAPDNAISYGIPKHQILEFAEWVGGRYSLWSSIGLSIAISIGYDGFLDMLDGAREMDQHFKTAPMEKNMPVVMALLGIWYSNFLGAQSTAVIPYCERLGLLPSYLQQLDMESNGKSTQLNGKSVSYDTGAILWGQTGTNGQHAFFQLLHQGTRLVPIDFIAAVEDRLSNEEHHRVLLGNMLAQGSALMCGQDAPDQQPHRYYPGNKPSNTLLMDSLSAKNFGSLIALYEHKVFVQGSIWNINSFDQWGVELGKKMANELLDDSEKNLDPSTSALFEYINKG